MYVGLFLFYICVGINFVDLRKVYIVLKYAFA